MGPNWAPRGQPIWVAHLGPNSRPAKLFLRLDVSNPFGPHKAAHFGPMWGPIGHAGWEICEPIRFFTAYNTVSNITLNRGKFVNLTQTAQS